MWGLLLLAVGLAAGADEVPPGQIVESVACAGDSSQTYALYLPSNYVPTRRWPLLVAFDPRARGLTAVERYQKAAEQFGYIVAGSNNSRNGSWESSQRSIQAMFADIPTRFAIDEKRTLREIYESEAGLSGQESRQASLARDAKGENDSADRRIARRVSCSMTWA